MLAAHSLLTEDWLEEGQQITEQEYCCSSAERLATRADKGKCPSSKAAVRQRSQEPLSLRSVQLKKQGGYL